MYIIYASYFSMKYRIRAKSCLPFSRWTASNINIETALNALQNLRREHVGASSLTTVSNPREGVLIQRLIKSPGKLESYRVELNPLIFKSAMQNFDLKPEIGLCL